MASDWSKEVNLVHLAKVTSEACQGFGFRMNEGAVTNGDRVCNY